MIDTSSELILFLSVDIVRSTAFKNIKAEKRDGKQLWLEFFKSFYDEFSNHILAGLTEKELLPDVWKTSGDEILFRRIIKNIKEVSQILLAFKKALKSYSEDLKLRKEPSLQFNLGVKGTAWIAGFPVINAKIPIDGGPGGNTVRDYDYIGPSIDAGFRLCKFSNEHKLTISIELAFILTEKINQERYKVIGGIYYEEDEPLKGVFEDRPYPIFWIFMDDETESLRMKLKGIRQRERAMINRYCRSFIRSVNNPFSIAIPYIVCDGRNIYNEIPKEHSKILPKLKNEIEALYEVATDIEKKEGREIPSDKIKTK